MSYLLVHFRTKRSLSFMSQSSCCTFCGTWNWRSRPTCHCCGQTPSASNGSSLVQVVKKGKTSGQGKGVHIKQQAKQQSNGVQAGSIPDTYINGEKLVNVKQLHAQIAAVSKALAELELSGDKELMQPLETRLAELKARLHGARPLAEAEIAKTGSRSHYYQRDRGYRELPGSTRGTRTPCFICGVSQGRWTGQWDARVASKHSIINRQTRAGEQQYRQRCSCTIPSRSAGPSTSACPTRCAAERNTGRHVRCVESREQARGQRRLATEHEQSAAHNEDDDRRDAATRGHQGSVAATVVRLMIATINVTSANSGGGAAKAHIPDTGGLNITGLTSSPKLTLTSSECRRVGYHKRRFFRRGTTRSSTLERPRVSITTAYSCGSGSDTQKP